MVKFRNWGRTMFKLIYGREPTEEDVLLAKKLKETEDRYYMSMAKVYGTI